MSFERAPMRILKVWQGSNLNIIFQIQISQDIMQIDSKKMYLIIDANPQSKNIYLTLEKPSQILNHGAIVQIIRKHMPSIWLADIRKDATSNNIYLQFKYGNSTQVDWYILFEGGPSPLIYFIGADRTTYFRFGKSGTFTKKQTFQGLLPELSHSATMSMLDTIIKSFTQNEQTPQDLGVEIEAEPQQEKLVIPVFQQEARKRLKRRLKTASKSLERQKNLTPMLQQIENTELKAKLLQQYSYRIKADQVELILQPEETGLETQIQIELDPNLSAGKNIENYFILSKKQKRAKMHGQQQVEKDTRSVQSMLDDIKRLETDILPESTVEDILLKHHITPMQSSQKKHQPTPSNKPYRLLKGDMGIDIMIGKSSSDNDELVKIAKSNDYWFHVIGLTGSHVIIPFKSLKNQTINEKQKRQAAMLAIHFSKVRNDCAGDVYFTQKQHLKKKKGMAPGLWNVEKSDTLYVKYTEEEIRELLNQLPENI